MSNISVVDSITKTDLQAYRAALKVYGISDRHLEKLEALDKLASDGGRLLLVSFRVTHQSYVGQLHNLDEIADDIKLRLKGTVDKDGNLVPMNDEDYSKLAKVYVECIKERGKGFQLMTAGMDTIDRMMRKAKEDAADKKGRRMKPGWGEMKKVRPLDGGENGQT